MNSWLTPLLSSTALLHGLVHLLGTVAYLRLGSVPGLPYKTDVLSGTLELGRLGTTVFGLLWGVAALGFVSAALALLLHWPPARPLLIGMVLLSLGLTLLDFRVAPLGVGVNLGLLVALLLPARLGLA